jgi:hypothetical protein
VSRFAPHVDNPAQERYTRGVTPEIQRLLRFVSVAFFALAVVWFAGALVTEGWSHRPSLAFLRRYAKVSWKTYRDFEFGFQLDHLSHWEVARPPSIAWTKRLGEGFRSEDVVVIRYHDPFTFVAVVRYRPEKPGGPVDWEKEVERKGFVASGFGERILQRATLQRHGRTAYEVVSHGPIINKTYRFASLFIPDGDVAWRITAGVEAKQEPRVAATIRRMLESFELESTNDRAEISSQNE